MYFLTLVTDVRLVIERLREQRGDYKLAMLYNLGLDIPSNWNLIVSSDWSDHLGVAAATRVIAQELHETVGLENRAAVSRITVLNMADPFVRDMTRLYPVPPGGAPLNQVTAGGISEGAAFVFYCQPEVPA